MKVQSSSKRFFLKVKWYNTIVETHNYVIKVEDDCRFMKINTTLNLGNWNPWVGVDSITQVLYHQDREDEDWSVVVDVEGRGFLEATKNPGLIWDRPLVESQIRKLAEGSKFPIFFYKIFYKKFT